MLKQVRVYHREYGCDSGCCGHTVEVEGKSEFDFNHPHWTGNDKDGRVETVLEFAKRMVRENFPNENLDDLDWEHAELDDVSES